MRIFGRHIPVPQSVAMRRTLGGALVAGGALGFLPVLGFWMVPLGLVVLSQDSALVRRKRRQIEVKLGRRWKSGWFASDKDKGWTLLEQATSWQLLLFVASHFTYCGTKQKRLFGMPQVTLFGMKFRHFHK
jgi:hypothetical protein